ncbi:MAG: hypothetical protein H0W48_02800 [Methylibium sp.]|nr:hypothetical protein [Methylibium sp.]
MRLNVNAAAQVYKKGLIDLESMVRATEKAVISESDHALLVTNINFFTKSFLISTCAHLEMCVKEIVFTLAADLDERLSLASVPTSIIEWRYSQKKKSDAANSQTQRLGIGMTRKEVDDLVSGNVYRTKDALALVGVDLAVDKAKWEAWNDLIQSMVTRRNNIVHHNDAASDLSLGDIRQYVTSTIVYIDFIVAASEAANKQLSK